MMTDSCGEKIDGGGIVFANLVGELLALGHSGQMQLVSVKREVATDDEVCVGIYFRVSLAHAVHGKASGVGDTPTRACERAISKLGAANN